jgi:hypothetical protein
MNAEATEVWKIAKYAFKEYVYSELEHAFPMFLFHIIVAGSKYLFFEINAELMAENCVKLTVDIQWIWCC